VGEKEGKGGKSNLVVLLAVALGVLFAFFTHVLLHCGIHEQFLCDGVARELPGELVAAAGLVVNVIWVVDDLVVVLLEFAMVCGDGFAYSSIGADKCRPGGDADGLRPRGSSCRS
jgi:hypothetical protein